MINVKLIKLKYTAAVQRHSFPRRFHPRRFDRQPSGRIIDISPEDARRASPEDSKYERRGMKSELLCYFRVLPRRICATCRRVPDSESRFAKILPGKRRARADIPRGM